MTAPAIPRPASTPRRRSAPQPGLSRPVRSLVSRLVGTVAHVDTLLALRRAAPRFCTLREIAEATGLPPGPVVRRCADELAAAGLVASPDDRCAYRYAPSTAELRESVDALAMAYHAQRTLVLRTLYGHPAVTLYGDRAGLPIGRAAAPRRGRTARGRDADASP